MNPDIEKLVKDLANNVISIKEAQDKLILTAADKGNVELAAKAIKQLEEQVTTIQASVEAKLAKVRRTTWDGAGKYVGCFDNEEQARAFGLYCLTKTAWHADCAAIAKRADEALKKEFPDIHARAMDSATDGALIVPEFSSRIQRLVEQFGTFERNAFSMPMGSDSLTFLRRTGGMTVFVVGENTAGTDSDPTHGNVTLNAKELGTLTYVPRTLDDDAVVMIAELLATENAQAFAEAGDDDGFNGDGTPTYHGFIGVRTRLASLNAVDDGGGLVLGTGNAYSELTMADHEAVQGSLPNYAAGNAKWYVSRKYFFTVMVRLLNAAGGVTAGELEGKRRMLFNGDPVEICQKLPSTAANSQICALYGDLRQAVTVGVRKAVTIETSRDYKFAERQMTYLGVRRMAINCHDLGTATEAGPVVGLITAAS